MPRSAEANRTVREAQRANLLAAARRLIAGGESLTMDHLAREAGVSQGLAYRYFRSQEVLFRAVMEEALRTSGPLVSRIDDLPGSAREQLETMLTRILERRRQNPEFYRFFIRALSERRFRGRSGDTMRRRFEQFQSRLRGLIVAAQRSGELPPDDPDELALVIVGCLQSIWRGMGRDSDRDAAPVVPRAEIVLRLLGPRPTGAPARAAVRAPAAG